MLVIRDPGDIVHTLAILDVLGLQNEAMCHVWLSNGKLVITGSHLSMLIPCSMLLLTKNLYLFVSCALLLVYSCASIFFLFE